MLIIDSTDFRMRASMNKLGENAIDDAGVLYSCEFLVEALEWEREA